jgi:hypothetical protein
MKLKTVTLITISGLAVAFAVFLIQWIYSPMMGLSRFSTGLLYGSLLFFLINLYRRS